MHRIVAAVLLGLALVGCTGDEQTDTDAERSVKDDAEMLAEVLEPLCSRQATCPQDYLPLALYRSLSEGNEVEFYEGRQFEVFLCVVNEEHGVWAYYQPENGAETHRGGEPCEFD